MKKIKWLSEQPQLKSGVTWGVPWKKGELKKGDCLALINAKGESGYVQSEPSAYWPDGSIKWTKHAAVFSQQTDTSFTLQKEETQPPAKKLMIHESKDAIQVDTGALVCTVNKTGSDIIQSLVMNGKPIAAGGRLIAIKETRKEMAAEKVFFHETSVSLIKRVVIEQRGPVKAVIKMEGVHVLRKTKEEWLPFIIRFTFYAGLSEMNIMHTQLIDRNFKREFIKGLGMQFDLFLQGEPYNRHFRFAGNKSVYKEPAQLFGTRKWSERYPLYQRHINGEPISPSEEHKEWFAHGVQNAVWNDMKLVQDSSDHYRLAKRTGKEYSWVDMLHGKRAKGLCYAGGENGGVALGLRYFFEKYPSSLEITGLADDQPNMTVWLWPPDAEAMDLRHYTGNTHVVSAYEGFDEMRSDPTGIANTNDISLSCFSQMPTDDVLNALADKWQAPPLLICEPDVYYESKALGVWSVIDTADPVKKELEEQLDAAFLFYQKEVEQRRWYGFWNYGDVMHTYDPIRHMWRYDLGGYAWQNNELVPTLWLWQAFFRSGREDLFRMAEAMTRHTSETDCFHLGEYAGLGSRHNVVHWGCGCKEARISMAGLYKFYYYLTGDERTGDLLTEVKDADAALVNTDPMRAFYEKGEHPTHVRTGPDWAAFCSNWLAEWERTENPEYLRKIQTGISCLKRLPLRLLSGPTFEYDPATSMLHHMGDGIAGGYHMIIAFGAPQVWMELAELLDDREWEEMLSEFGEFYTFSDEEKRKKSGGVLHDGHFHWPMFAAGMTAYAARKKQDHHLAEKAWNLLLDHKLSHTPLPIKPVPIETWTQLEELPWVTTNTISQWCLNVIAALELIGEYLPAKKDTSCKKG
ncbi:exo-rhamnogalacturonan lyase family protein [Bacillus mojavensis]